MADDIDDLLDEVETKFCVKARKTSSNSKAKPTRKKTGDDNLDKMIDDICDVPTELEDSPRLSNEHSQKSTGSDEPKRKCFPVYLGGSTSSQGMASSLSKRSCDKLRCTSCDFRVSSFDNYEWNPKTDYLFLRNNAPDFHKLKSNLVAKRGSRAYCCQCCWRTYGDLTVLQDTELRWVCGKH